MLWSTDENGVCDELDGMGAMQLVREAWADWVASKVYLIRSREWEPGTEGNCYQQRTPINTEVYWESGSDLPTMQIVDTALSRALGKHKGAHSKYQGLQVGTNACNLNN
ncbi:hypothetical protein MKX03_004386 [Papaver bracteatum]|nr:hypothetical protein MKX03_004386 [Papaver bracteatum]